MVPTYDKENRISIPLDELTKTPAVQEQKLSPDLQKLVDSGVLTSEKALGLSSKLESSALDIYKKTTPAPKPIDERRVNASRVVAGVGEGLSVLGQMIGSRSGARVQRNQGVSPIDAQMSREDRVRDLYSRRVTDYNAGVRSAMQQDSVRAEAERRRLEQEAKQDARQKVLDARYQTEWDYRVQRDNEAAEERKAREAADQKNIETSNSLRKNEFNIRLAESKDAKAAAKARAELQGNILKYSSQAQIDKAFLNDPVWRDRIYLSPPSFGNPGRMVDKEALADAYYQWVTKGGSIYDIDVSSSAKPSTTKGKKTIPNF